MQEAEASVHQADCARLHRVMGEGGDQILNPTQARIGTLWSQFLIMTVNTDGCMLRISVRTHVGLVSFRHAEVIHHNRSHYSNLDRTSELCEHQG